MKICLFFNLKKELSNDISITVTCGYIWQKQQSKFPVFSSFPDINDDIIIVTNRTEVAKS